MEFYVIPPTTQLELMNKGDRFFCLAQLYIKPENSAYREFFKQKVKEGRWVTLDNGAGDHALVSPQMLMSVVEDLLPTEVIPPDILFDGPKTIFQFHHFLNLLDQFTHQILSFYRPKILGCPQGATKEDWLFTYKYMLNHPQVEAIGFSKIAIPHVMYQAKNDRLIKQSRNLMWDDLKSKGLLQKPIHFLGMGDPREFRHYKGSKFARSTDSCNTVWSGMNNILFDKGEFTRIPTPKDYFDRLMYPDQIERAEKNIEWMRGLLSNCLIGS